LRVVVVVVAVIFVYFFRIFLTRIEKQISCKNFFIKTISKGKNDDETIPNKYTSVFFFQSNDKQEIQISLSDHVVYANDYHWTDRCCRHLWWSSALPVR
jgi:hypothetical protein